MLLIAYLLFSTFQLLVSSAIESILFVIQNTKSGLCILKADMFLLKQDMVEGGTKSNG